jgi:dynein heavy chain
MVSTVIDRLDAYIKNGDGKYNVDLTVFNEQMKLLTTQYNEAKDNEKFLNTLERQFKNLNVEGPEGLKIILETIPSLLNGLKLIWTISRHYRAPNKMESLFQKITNEISLKVEKQINIRELVQPKKDVDYESQLDNAIKLIELGKLILSTWRAQYNLVKKQVEDEGNDRWVFAGSILQKNTYVSDSIFDNLIELCDTMKQFLAFLGPNLKKVTGDTAKIDNLIAQVKELADPFITFPFDPYDRNYKSNWQTMHKKFRGMVNEIDEKTKKLIVEAFSDLRSSEGAFDLLQNFKHIATRPEIRAQMEQKYSDVLLKY